MMGNASVKSSRAKPATRKPSAKSAVKPSAIKSAPKAAAAKKAPSNKAKPAKPAKRVDDGWRLSATEQDALALVRAAMALDQAKSQKDLAAALDANLQLWVAIRTEIERPGNPLPTEVRENLLKLAEYVADVAVRLGSRKASAAQIKGLININLQISEGLLEGQTLRRIQERAYHIWEEKGRPHGRDHEHWYEAECEVRTKLQSFTS